MTLTKPTNNLGLLGYWKFDEGAGTVAQDASGNGKTGSLVGTPAWVNGKKGGALDFNGVDQYLDTSLSLASGDGTVSTWFSARSQITGVGSIRQFVQQGNGVGSGSLSFGMLLPVAGSAVRCTWTTSGTPATTSGTAYNDSKWHFAACVKTGSTLNLYVDGVLAATGTSNANPNSNILVQIGGSTLGASYKFNGSLDDIRIYSRALSATEVAALYQTGQATIRPDLPPTTLNASSAILTKGSTLSDGLVGLWTFDGPDLTDKIYDRSGNNNNGYFIGAATSTAKVAGKLGQALTFDGADSAVTIADSPSLRLASDSTIAAWIKPKSIGEGSAGRIVDKSTTTAGLNGYIFSLGSDNTLSFRTSGNEPSISTNNAVMLNTWQHVAVVSTAARKKLYVNGVDVTNNFLAGLPPDIAGTVSIGNRVGASDRTFDGSVDDVRFYNRALSDAEVKQLYSLGK